MLIGRRGKTAMRAYYVQPKEINGDCWRLSSISAVSDFDFCEISLECPVEKSYGFTGLEVAPEVFGVGFDSKMPSGMQRAQLPAFSGLLRLNL